MGKTLVVTGLIVAGAGLLIMLGVPLGRLPGDIVYRRDGFTVYLPIATCLLLSVVLTLLVALVRR
jgi:predicted MFS family arabinose efflux permease